MRALRLLQSHPPHKALRNRQEKKRGFPRPLPQKKLRRPNHRFGCRLCCGGAGGTRKNLSPNWGHPFSLTPHFKRARRAYSSRSSRPLKNVENRRFSTCYSCSAPTSLMRRRSIAALASREPPQTKVPILFSTMCRRVVCGLFKFFRPTHSSFCGA